MATRDEVFPSKWWKCEDLGGKPMLVQIEHAQIEAVNNQQTGKTDNKVVVYFKGSDKGLILNLTNWDVVATITGEEDSDNWAGHKLVLYPSTTHFGGKTVPCIRIRAPKAAPIAAAAQRGAGIRPVPVQELAPAEEDLAAQMDDEIPF